MITTMTMTMTTTTHNGDGDAAIFRLGARRLHPIVMIERREIDNEQDSDLGKTNVVHFDQITKQVMGQGHSGEIETDAMLVMIREMAKMADRSGIEKEETIDVLILMNGVDDLDVTDQTSVMTMSFESKLPRLWGKGNHGSHRRKIGRCLLMEINSMSNEA